MSEHSSILNTTDIAIQKNKKVRELITNGWGYYNKFYTILSDVSCGMNAHHPALSSSSLTKELEEINAEGENSSHANDLMDVNANPVQSSTVPLHCPILDVPPTASSQPISSLSGPVIPPTPVANSSLTSSSSAASHLFPFATGKRDFTSMSSTSGDTPPSSFSLADAVASRKKSKTSGNLHRSARSASHAPCQGKINAR